MLYADGMLHTGRTSQLHYWPLSISPRCGLETGPMSVSALHPSVLGLGAEMKSAPRRIRRMGNRLWNFYVGIESVFFTFPANEAKTAVEWIHQFHCPSISALQPWCWDEVSAKDNWEKEETGSSDWKDMKLLCSHGAMKRSIFSMP